MAEPRDLGERIGLGYLYKTGKVRSAGSPEQVQSSGVRIDPTLSAFGARAVLQAIQQAEDGRGPGSHVIKPSEIAEDVGIEGATLIALFQQLESVGLLEIPERTRFGDDPARLTPKARNLLESKDNSELMRVLGLQ